ncbi:J domain-containing protein [Sphingomonas sp.]|uniref:J domain-containing protein n=1 Tax=Sphingomonas sp. TaxID=28214 RepID=UPI00286D96EF|nr:J domain-containing protein [Sphingomonas sp.]
MSADRSAFVILGLEPGAEPAAIEAAYKKLIKRFHPDRKGGSAKRAAEINRAYSELRNRPAPELERDRGDELSQAIYERDAAIRASRRAKPRPRSWWPVLLVALAVAALVDRRTVADLTAAVSDRMGRVLDQPDFGRGGGAQATAAADLDAPVDASIIAAAVISAQQLVAAGDRDALAERSRRCHFQMREQPSLERLDRCAAFEDAVAMLQGSDLVRDDGHFRASAVTARQMNAARLLSDDYLAIEARLDQIRGRVWLMLSPTAREAGILLDPQ